MAIPAVLLAGISKGGFGSGAAFAATPFLALILEPVQAVALMLPVLMIIDVGALRAWWGRWDRESAAMLTLGALAGIGVGAMIFSAVNVDAMRFMIGSVALGFLAFQLARARGWLVTPPNTAGRGKGLFWGAVAGVTSFVSHAGGPPAAIYLLGRRLSKETYQATTVIVFAAINFVKVFVYAGMGLFDPTMLLAVVTLAPVAILGTILGVQAHRHLPERLFFGLIYVFLGITGTKLILDALT